MNPMFPKYNNFIKKTELLDNENNIQKREVLFEKHNWKIEQKRLRKITIEKWDKTGLLSNLSGMKKSNIAHLFESQASQIINEARVDVRENKDNSVYNHLNNWRRLIESQNQTIGVSSRGFGGKKPQSKFKKFLNKIKNFFISLWGKVFKKKKEPEFPNLLPLAMRVSAQPVALDLTPVQPLSLPSGMLFYLDLPEREDVFNRKVLIEKYKKPNSRYHNEISYRDHYRFDIEIDLTNLGNETPQGR